MTFQGLGPGVNKLHQIMPQVFSLWVKQLWPWLWWYWYTACLYIEGQHSQCIQWWGKHKIVTIFTQFTFCSYIYWRDSYLAKISIFFILTHEISSSIYHFQVQHFRIHNEANKPRIKNSAIAHTKTPTKSNDDTKNINVCSHIFSQASFAFHESSQWSSIIRNNFFLL